MDIDIIEESENPMLHRTDVRFEVRHEDATPARLSVRDSLAATLNKNAEEVVVRELDTKFGMRKTVGLAKVYDSPSDAQAVEQDHMLQRNKIVADGEGAVVAEPAPETESEDEEPAEDAEEAEPETEADEADEPDEEAADEAEADDETDDAEDEPEAESEDEEAPADEGEEDADADETAEADAEDSDEDADEEDA